MKLAEEKKVVLVASALNYDTAATAVTKGINMKGYHRCTFLVDIASLGAADVTYKAFSGASDLALTSALAFKYAYGGSSCIWVVGAATPVAGADVLAAETTVTAATGLVVTQVTYPNYMLLIEVDASTMDVANDENWLSLEITCGAGTGLATIFAVLDSRYTKNLSATALS